ncbi:MAG TPA: pyrroloquinoline quinone biosynthesis peptide chaperone PqqD [Stellaceae bacterium]|nr:pyrroloquinoline quinone biosynthesis peptide chaperone PqqD [Stellaceae bacterium]
MTGPGQRLLVEGAHILRFAAHTRMSFDEKRNRWMVLAPERLLLPDAPAVEILKRIDGAKSVTLIIDELAAQFDAPREVIARDVGAVLQDLLDKGILTA